MFQLDLLPLHPLSSTQKRALYKKNELNDSEKKISIGQVCFQVCAVSVCTCGDNAPLDTAFT